MKLSTRLAILLPLGIVVILVLEAFIFWRSDSILARETTKRIIASELEGVARTGAAFLDPKLHKKVSLGLGHESPEWQQLRAALDIIAKQNDLTPDHCYTFARPTGDHSKLQFAVMLQTPTFEGHVYEVPPANIPLIDQLVIEKKPVSTDIYRDEHGEWISAMAPIMTKDGELTGILEVDYTAKDALAKTRSLFFDIRLKLHATMALVALIALVMSLVFAWRWVIRPLGNIQAFAEGVAAGRSPEELKIGTRGELAALAGALNLLAERLQRMVENAQETSTKVASLTTGVAESARALAQDSSVQARASEQTADFVVRVDESSQVVSKESGQVTNLVIETTASIEEMMAQVKEIDRSVDSLSESTNVTATSVQEMGTNIAEVAQNAEWLNEQVTDAAAAVEEMRQSIGNVEQSGGHLLKAAESTSSAISHTMASIQKVEESAQESIRLTEVVVSDAEGGRKRVRETMEGADAARTAIRRVVEVNSHLEQSGEAIGEILDLIDQVAEQTNVLALNAALIAAEAGGQGKAFGVVAGKIRELSASTAEKTKDIAELIASVKKDVVNATKVAKKAERAAAESSSFASEAKGALDQIVHSAKEASDLSRGIAQATVEQIAKGREIASAMEQVKEFSNAIGRATSEEGRTANRLVETMVSSKEKSDLFKRATDELMTGSGQIVEAMENVTGQVREISRATDEQAKGGKSIMQSMTEMEETAVKLTDSAGLQSRASKQAVDAVVEIREIIKRNEQRIREMDHDLSVLLGESRRLLRDVESISL